MTALRRVYQYGTYRFKDKDPVIDIARTCVEIYAAQRNVKFGRALTELSRTSNVSLSAMYGWFYGKTISPRFCCVVAVVLATGSAVKVGKETVGRVRLRAVS